MIYSEGFEKVETRKRGAEETNKENKKMGEIKKGLGLCCEDKRAPSSK